MQIFKTHFISGVPFVSGLLSIEVVIWTILLLGSKEFWGKWHPDASLMGHNVHRPLQCPLVIGAVFCFVFI